jgi:phage gpG-like protein
MDGVMGSLDELQELISGKRRDIMRYGRSIMKSETKRAFSSKVDPRTGRAWAPRKGQYPWPLLYNSGDLFGSLEWGYGIKTKNKRLKFFGKVGGGQAGIIRAGAVHYGRTKARTSRGGKRFGVMPSTGATPPRPIFGFGRSARKRIKRYAEKRLAKAFD